MDDIVLEMDIPQYALDAILSGEFAVIAFIEDEDDGE